MPQDRKPKRKDDKRKKDSKGNWLTRDAKDTKIGTGQAEKARKKLKNRMKTIEQALEDAGA